MELLHLLWLKNFGKKGEWKIMAYAKFGKKCLCLFAMFTKIVWKLSNGREEKKSNIMFNAIKSTPLVQFILM